jgi:5-methylcytosine-specific restriction enzyme B
MWLGTTLVSYWWVNQGRTFADELSAGFLWCSMVDRGGRTPWHWRTMTSIRDGDLVLHYARGQVHAVSRVSPPSA